MKEKEITTVINGISVFLSARSAMSALDLIDFSRKRDNTDERMATFINARCIEDSLHVYLQKLPYIKRLFTKRKLTALKIMKHLSVAEINSLAVVILSIEGTDVKKKLMEETATNQKK